MRKPRIVVIGTGGTIASSAGTASEARRYEVAFGVDELLAAVPDLAGLAEITYQQPLNVDSSQIDSDDLLHIGKAVEAALMAKDVDGVVITHGTDTMEETAFFLHLVQQSAKPVVMTGAMRPATALGAEGPMNLYDAVVAACAPQVAGLGVVVVMGGAIFSARDVMKRDSGAICALEGGKYGQLGEVAGDKVILNHRPARPHGLFSLAGLGKLAQVDILFDHQGAGDWLAKAALQAGAQGLVIAGTGNGSLSKGSRAGAEFARLANIPVVRASRTGQGYVSAQADGLIHAASLPPQKARVLLMLALTQKSSDLQALFELC